MRAMNIKPHRFFLYAARADSYDQNGDTGRPARRTHVVNATSSHTRRTPIMDLQSYLDRFNVRYQVSEHPAAYTAQGLAQAEHVSGRRVIKPVLVECDGQMVLCALPACDRVDLEALRE